MGRAGAEAGGSSCRGEGERHTAAMVAPECPVCGRGGTPWGLRMRCKRGRSSASVGICTAGDQAQDFLGALPRSCISYTSPLDVSPR